MIIVNRLIKKKKVYNLKFFRNKDCYIDFSRMNLKKRKLFVYHHF